MVNVTGKARGPAARVLTTCLEQLEELPA